nr:hypothetical protein [Kibdelosporangium sp. MJ126-NF4]CEL13289.1 proline rich protein (membrane protein) [Kibdelosporangium sp. MJ126-NF4]CTQ98980.1 proline rich protein (membrane protein) [Kibdelosporangium sp. MJ126-NF4]
MTRLTKWLRLLGFARGPLSRRSDRAQRALVITTVVAALVAIPVAADAAGGVKADPVVATRQTTAILSEDAHIPTANSEYGPVDGTKVKAGWKTPQGTYRSGDVKVTVELKAGEAVPIWTDDAGNVVDGPRTSGQQVMQMIFAAGLAVLGWFAGVLVCYLLVAWLLFRRQVVKWADAWERADRDWRRTV